MPDSSSILAILNGKCPRCRQGNIFAYPVTKLSSFNKMNSQCPRCGLRLEPEPGFYQGAMYVGYAFTLVLMGIISLLLYILGNPSEIVYILTVIGTMVVLAPLNYRYSRILYLHLFGGIKYDRKLSG
jgi:uncharacterized protein (DUF983 family)